MQTSSIIKKPVLTEKATESAKRKVYVFEVVNRANKHQIQEALAQLYDVQIGRVWVVNRHGKTRRVGRRLAHKKLPNRKIAYVEVTKGKIDLFPES